jgi:Ca2+-binding EF-hand superfamily protein
LSPRECRNLKHVLAALDLDGDGVISARERPTAIRIAVARGPHAHEMLAEPISAAREFASSGQTTAAPPPTTASSAKVPAWFTEMDRNGDGDVSRSEFLGTLEQFKELDRDQDGLISSQEASE